MGRPRVIPKGAAVMAVMAAGNRDPRRFADPDRLDLERQDNRHPRLWLGSTFSAFGAPLARMEGRIAFKGIAPVACLNLVLGEGKLELARESRAARPSRPCPVTFS